MAFPSDPFDFPHNVIQSVQFTSDSRVAVTTNPFNFKQQKFAYGGQRWRASVTTKPMKKEKAEEIVGLLVSLNGPERLLHIGDPNRPNLLGNEDGSPVVDGTDNDVGDEELGLRNLNTKASDPAFKAGDWIQITVGGTASQRRLYKILRDTNQSSGKATVPIYPTLRESPVDGESVVISDTKGTFQLDSRQQSWSWSLPDFSTISFEVVEAI